MGNTFVNPLAPKPEPYRHQEFPKMLYHEDPNVGHPTENAGRKQSYVVVNNEAEMEVAIARGFGKKPLVPELPPEPAAVAHTIEDEIRAEAAGDRPKARVVARGGKKSDV